MGTQLHTMSLSFIWFAHSFHPWHPHPATAVTMIPSSAGSIISDIRVFNIVHLVCIAFCDHCAVQVACLSVCPPSSICLSTAILPYLFLSLSLTCCIDWYCRESRRRYGRKENSDGCILKRFSKRKEKME